MAVGEIFAKGLVVIKGDTSHARAEVAKLSAEEQKAAKARIKAQEEHNSAMERSNQRFQLYAAGAVAGWAIISKSVKTYEEHLKSLGASGESELKRLQGATGALSDSQKNLEIAIGKVAVQAAPAALALADMANELANIIDGIGGLVGIVTKNLPGGGSLLSYAIKYGGPIAQGRAIGNFAVNQARNALGGGGGGVQNWIANREINAFEQAMRDGEEGAMAWGNPFAPRGQPVLPKPPTKPAPKKRRGGGRAKVDPYAGVFESLDLGATSGYSSGRYSQEDLDLLGLGDEPVAAEMGWKGFEVPKGVLEDLVRLQDELAGEQREGFLASIFGPVSEFELYTTAWQGLESVVTAGFDAWISGSKSVGAAMKEALHGFAKQLAGEALLQALRHTAYGIGSLAIGGPLAGASAGKHFTAAAVWGSVAAAATAVGKVSAPAQSAAGGRGNAYAAAGIGGGGGGGNARNANLTVVMGDGFADDSPRYKARRVRRAINQARNLYPESGATEQG